jgi:predicted neuraminidase
MRKKVILFIVLSFTITIIMADPFKGIQCIIKSELLFKQGDVPFPSCHASTIVQTSNGLLAAWFGGTAEKNPDVGLWISHFKDGKWSKPIEAANGVQYKSKRYPCWNPVLYNNRNEILLFFKVGPSPSEWWGEMMSSKDDGNTWSRACHLPGDIYGPVKNKPILLPSGVLLCGSSTEYDGWRVHLEMTSDNGLTWDRTAALNRRDTGIIQPTLLLYKNGKIQMLCRSDISCILSSWSGDNGQTWNTFRLLGLPNPNSGIDAVTLKDGRQLLVYNHLTKGRNMLNIAVSGDGQKWDAAVLLENDKTGSEFSYPAVIQTNDGLIHITYTWNRVLIKHVVIDPSKIIIRPFNNREWPDE